MGTAARLALLVVVSLGHTFCQETKTLGEQNATTCTFLAQRTLVQAQPGTTFSAICNPQCVRRKASENQHNVYGTGVYSLDSDLCLAAVHDARLPQPSTLSDRKRVSFTVSSHSREVVGSFKRGVVSGSRSFEEKVLRFISEKVIEDVPDITSVHTNFRRGKTTTYFKCHVGTPEDAPNIQLFSEDSTDSPWVLESPRRSDDGHPLISERRNYGDRPVVSVCRLSTTVYSDTTSIDFTVSPYFTPEKLIYRASVGDDVRMQSSGYHFRCGYTVWERRDGTFMGETADLTLRNVQVSDAGTYLLKCDDSYDYATAIRLIVRGCPEKLYGTLCDKTCPHCMHGGQCHDVTGECVCPAGFHGPKCENGCPAAQFGRKCSAVCPRENCRGRLLCVPDPYGCSCAPGFTGIGCQQECSDGYYGPDCAFTCGRCARSTCNKFNGACSDGCGNSNVLPPLCQPLAPWFRDPPELVETGYTQLTVRHRVWNAEYDNGLGSGSYRYIAQHKRSDATEDWSTGSRPSLPPGPFVQFILEGLAAETRYSIRIVIEDLDLHVSEKSDAIVPSIKASTDCAEPLSVGEPHLENGPGPVVNVFFQTVANFEMACRYTLNVTATPTAPDAIRRSFIIQDRTTTRAVLRDLTPYSTYTVSVYAVNRKGSGPTSSATILTPEAAPAEVTNLEAVRVNGMTFRIGWNTPERLNGRLRQYKITILHERYLACDSSVTTDFQDSEQLTTMDRTHVIQLKHAFSLYSVSVVAVTVAEGPATKTSFATDPSAPSANIPRVTPSALETAIQLDWQWPGCSSWADKRSNLRLLVETKGKSTWNQKFQRKQNISTTLQIADLVPFSNYSLRIYMCNSIGCYPEAVIADVLTKESAPGVPENVTIVNVSPTSVTLGWEPPQPPRSRITGYLVGYQHGSSQRTAKDFEKSEACPADRTKRPRCRAKLSDLAEDTNYTLSVNAFNGFTRVQGPAAYVTFVTGEGVPGPPADLRLIDRTQTSLNVSWLEPTEKNGRLQAFQLNVTVSARSPEGRRRREVTVSRSIDIPMRQGRQLSEADKRYSHEVSGLRPGRTYLVQVAARTSVGFGPPLGTHMDTLVAPPVIAAAPTLRPGKTTATTVELVLPSVKDTGGPVSGYFVIVSSDPAFNGSQLTPYTLLEAEDEHNVSSDFYVTAALPMERVQRDSTFVLGDDLHYNSSSRPYHNRPLALGVTYRVGVAVLSRLSDDNQQLAFRPTDDVVLTSQPSDAGLVAGIVIFVFLLLLLAILAVIYVKRPEKIRALLGRKTRGPGGMSLEPMPPIPAETDEEIDEEEGDGEEAIYQNLQPNQINYSRIEAAGLAEATRQGIETGLFRSQMLSLPHGSTRPCNRGLEGVNRRKNRYVNLIAYDDTRVVLEKLAQDDSSDYINANYVDGYNRHREYIATQGPKDETVFDFWRMVWQEKVERIVMLTNLVEGGKRKCNLYWPENEEPLHLPGMDVQLNGQTMYNDYIIRSFTVVKGNQNRTVTQLHYTAWPDHSVPMYPASLARFIRALQAVPSGDAPTVVHCSAGAGRTGSVILIDAMYQMGCQERSVDVYSHLSVARQQRPNFCANHQQYQLVHEVLVELLVSPHTAVPAAELAAKLPQLKDRSGGPSLLEKQLQHLNSIAPSASYASVQDSERTKDKNRSLRVLPEDSSRVYLSRLMPDSYINAVFVDGFKMKNAFIATELPLPKRISIFWEMVAQKSSSTIVIMNGIDDADAFWPNSGETLRNGKLAVSAKAETETENIITMDLLLEEFDGPETVGGSPPQSVSTRSVCLLRLNAGGEPTMLPSADALLRLHNAFQRRLAGHGDGPAVVVCRTGVTGCGLFLAVCFELAQLAEEQQLDVAMAVTAVRKSRPQFVSTLEQIELCYDVAIKWLEAFATYSNFV